MITFKEFLTDILHEDINQINTDLLKLQGDIADIDAKINRINQQALPFTKQKNDLQRRYSQLLKQKQSASRQQPKPSPDVEAQSTTQPQSMQSQENTRYSGIK